MIKRGECALLMVISGEMMQLLICVMIVNNNVLIHFFFLMTISVEQLYANNLIDVKLKYIFINSAVTDCYLVYCFLVMSKIYTVISHNKSRLIFLLIIKLFRFLLPLVIYKHTCIKSGFKCKIIELKRKA